MDDWRTWKASEESSHIHKDDKAAELLLIQGPKREGHRTKQRDISRQPALTRSGQGLGTPEHSDLEVEFLIQRLLTGMEALLEGQAASGTKKRRSSATKASPPS